MVLIMNRLYFHCFPMIFLVIVTVVTIGVILLMFMLIYAYYQLALK